MMAVAANAQPASRQSVSIRLGQFAGGGVSKCRLARPVMTVVPGGCGGAKIDLNLNQTPTQTQIGVGVVGVMRC